MSWAPPRPSCGPYNTRHSYQAVLSGLLRLCGRGLVLAGGSEAVAEVRDGGCGREEGGWCGQVTPRHVVVVRRDGGGGVATGGPVQHPSWEVREGGRGRTCGRQHGGVGRVPSGSCNSQHHQMSTVITINS